MAESLAEILNALLLRLRDPAGSATSRALALDILLRSQQMYNESLRLKLLEVSFPTLPLTQIYPLTSDLMLSSVSHVRHQNRDLFKVTFGDLQAMNRKWHRALSTRYECWLPLGFTHVLVWPGLTESGTVTLIGPALTQNPVSEQVSLEISQERAPLLIQLAELILLNRLQDETAFQAIVQNFVKFLPQEILKESRGAHA